MKFIKQAFVLMLAAALLAFPVSAMAAQQFTSEVLVLNSAPTLIPRNGFSTGFELFNNGPNTIFCAFGEGAGGTSPTYPDGGLVVRLNKARPIAPGGTWSGIEQPSRQIWCQAATADQVTGAATILSESY